MQPIVEPFDCDLASVAGGRAALRARLADAGGAPWRGLPEEVRTEAAALVLDATRGFPAEVVVGGVQPFPRMGSRNLEFLDPGALAAEVFRYSPPEGSPLLDGRSCSSERGRRGPLRRGPDGNATPIRAELLAPRKRRGGGFRQPCVGRSTPQGCC